MRIDWRGALGASLTDTGAGPASAVSVSVTPVASANPIASRKSLTAAIPVHPSHDGPRTCHMSGAAIGVTFPLSSLTS